MLSCKACFGLIVRILYRFCKIYTPRKLKFGQRETPTMNQDIFPIEHVVFAMSYLFLRESKMTLGWKHINKLTISARSSRLIRSIMCDLHHFQNSLNSPPPVGGALLRARGLQSIRAEFQQSNVSWKQLKKLGGGFKHFLFSPLPGEDSHFDSYFLDGLKPPTRKTPRGEV